MQPPRAPLPTHSPADLMGPAYFRMVEQIGLADDDREAALGTVKNVIDTVDRHHGASVAVKSDADLTDAGKESRIKALVERHDALIHAWTKKPLQNLADRAQKLRGTIDNATTAAPTVSQVMLMIEARKHLNDIDVLPRTALLKRLAEDGSDDITLDAALSAPVVGRLVDATTAGELKQVKAARLQPDIAVELAKTLETHGVLLNTISAARHAIASPVERGRLGVADSTTRAAIALGASMSIPAADAPGA